MIEVKGILVEKDIITCPFLCDITACNGACCTFPGIYGAPLNDSEVPILEKHISKVEHLLSQKSKTYITEHGVAENTSGRPTTVCINSKDCVFVYYEKNNPIALCSIEKIYLQNKTNFRKPISCWLFPIRAAFHNTTMYLYYEKIKECNSAIKNGKQKNIKIYQALKEPLIALLGEKWYEELATVARELENNKK